MCANVHGAALTLLRRLPRVQCEQGEEDYEWDREQRTNLAFVVLRDHKSCRSFVSACRLKCTFRGEMTDGN